jgi:chorismate-pyruvate lyase
MTEVLAEFFGCEVDLRVLEAETDPETGFYHRRIVLVAREGRRVVEHGWLSVALAALPQQVAEELVQGDAPFGRHLRTLATPFRVEADGWFRAEVTDEVASALGVRAGTSTLGRRSRICAEDDGRVLARAVEVLTPLDERDRPAPGSAR